MLQPVADPLVYGNIGLHHTALFRGTPRLRGVCFPWREWFAADGWEGLHGPWANIGTPADLAALDTQDPRPRRTP
jgi:hypothetical protein